MKDDKAKSLPQLMKHEMETVHNALPIIEKQLKQIDLPKATETKSELMLPKLQPWSEPSWDKETTPYYSFVFENHRPLSKGVAVPNDKFARIAVHHRQEFIGFDPEVI